jgi:type IV pilus assembly protein PilM
MSLFGTNRILAIDIGASRIKLAEFTFGRGGMELTGIHQAPLDVVSQNGEVADEASTTLAIVNSLQTTIKEKNIKPAPVLMSVTGQSAFLKLVKLLPVKRSKVYQTVLYEAQQNALFPMDEVVWDYQLMGASETELVVILALIKRDIIENLTDCVEAIGLEVELVDVAPMALYNAVCYNYGDLGECTLVIDIGARATNLVFMETGLFWSRNLPLIGSGNLITQQLMKEFNLEFAEAEGLKFAHASVAFGGAYEDFSDKTIAKVSKTVRTAMTRLHIEVERSINLWRTQQGGHSPSRILLAGGGSIIARTDEFFKEKTRVDVEYLNPFKNVIVANSISEEEIGKCAHLMGEVVGVGLRHALPCPLEINLIPPKVQNERNFRRKQPFFLAAMLGLIFVAFLWLFYFSVMTNRLREKNAAIAQEARQLENVEKRIKPYENEQRLLIRRISGLDDIVRQRTKWLEMLNAIHASMPDGMWLVALKPFSKVLPGGAAKPETAASTFRPRKPPPVQGAAAPSVFNALEIEGRIFVDKEEDRPIDRFRDQLKQSAFFDVTNAPVIQPVGADDFARAFRMEVELKEEF